MKLCTQCRYSFVPWRDIVSLWLFPELYDRRCGHPKSTDISRPSAIDGAVVVRYFPCHYMRGSTEPCGTEGKLWEPGFFYMALRLLRIVR